VRQAYLQEVEAQDARMSAAILSETVLGDSFGAVGAVSITADGERVAAGTLGGAVRVWRMTDRAPLLSARAHAGAIWSVALSPDRRYERMEITGLRGITEAQRATLLSLGAVDDGRG
jgi:hypothetical protein